VHLSIIGLGGFDVAIGLGAALIGSAVIGSATSAIGGKKAAKAQRKAAEAQATNERYFYDTARADFTPFREVGTSAIRQLGSEFGLKNPDGTAIAPTGSGFMASPGYQFRLNEGIKAQERSAASRGLLRSGAAVKAIQRYGEGLASSEYGDYFNRLAGLAGAGQSASGSTAAAGGQAASGISNAIGNAGNARASSYINTASSINQGLNNIFSVYGRFGK
jgi:hypothetical protein